MKLTYYGHACFEVELNGSKILFDPFITPNSLASHINIGTLNPDFILVSHGHGDHVADVEAIARRSGAMIVSNFEIVSWFAAKGLENTFALNHGGAKVFDFGKLKYVNAVHSSMLPDGSNGGNPGGFVIESTEGNFYFAGDTALTLDMQLIGGSTELLFSILPIGDVFTMGIDDAVIASNFLKCNKIIGMHYDTFPPIVIDHSEARRKFRNAEDELILMEIGETKEINTSS